MPGIRHPQAGQTLTEVMVAMVLVAILALGVVNLLAAVQQEFQQLSWRQKAIFLLSGEVERLRTYYRREFLYYQQATHADDTTSVFGRWLYRATPQGTICPDPADPQCLVVTATDPAAVTKAAFPDGKILYMNVNPRFREHEHNVVWLDRERDLTARLAWQLYDLQPVTGNSCCQGLRVSLSYPYRFREGVSPYEAVAGLPAQTLTQRGVVCGKCPYPVMVAATGQNVRLVQYDDGDLRKGVVVSQNRLVDQGDGTVIDRLTDLQWMKNADCWGDVTQLEAIDKISLLNRGMASCSGYSAGYSDWRIPNFREMLSIIDFGRISNSSPPLPPNHPFVNFIPMAQYLTGTYCAPYGSGYKIRSYYTGTSYNPARCQEPQLKDWFGYARNGSRVVPVRSAGTYQDICSIPAPVAETGQRTSRSVGDDGNLRMGATVPVPRHVQNGDGTVTDNLTGLVWMENRNLGNDCLGPDVGVEELSVAIGSIALCNSSRVSTYSDWRLPNIRELETLFDYNGSGTVSPPLSGYQMSSTVSIDMYQGWKLYGGEPVLHKQQAFDNPATPGFNNRANVGGVRGGP